MNKLINFNYEWQFLKASAFPLSNALEGHTDISGHYFYEKEYELSDEWTGVSVPHTFNDEDLFKARIKDAGSGQERTFSFYRKIFTVEASDIGKKFLLEFEGIRQSCYLYVNGILAGYHENGVAPLAFDISKLVTEGENLIAIATDNTCTRDVDFCMAETPNCEGVEPGSYMAVLTGPGNEKVPAGRRGVGFFWNCNDFNPSVGGLSRNIRLHIKPLVYQTLPIYSNLETKGVYIYANDFDIKGKKATINIEAELRNESGKAVEAVLVTDVFDVSGKCVASHKSKAVVVAPAMDVESRLSITPASAYKFNNETGGYVPLFTDEESKQQVFDTWEAEKEQRVCENKYEFRTVTASRSVSMISDSFLAEKLRFWSTYDPYLYTVKTTLYVDGEPADTVETVTGFRKTGYDNKKGLLINDEPVWLRGYAQRSANEWAAIGCAPDWLKDFDAKLIKESNANHIRWMHIAAMPADIRSCDRFGVVCTQPAGDKERENFGRQWEQRMELMRDIIIYFRNNPSIIFWEAGNNAVHPLHMREMTVLKRELDKDGGRFMGCRTLNTIEALNETEYVGTMLNRFAGRFQSEYVPITETEYLREESPRRVWDDFSAPDYDYDNLWLGRQGRKQEGGDIHDLTAEEFAVAAARAYSEFYLNKVGGISGKDLYASTAALCWTDSAQHGRQSASENARMSGRVDAVRIKKQSFEAFKTFQADKPAIHIVGHFNYPKPGTIDANGNEAYKYPLKEFNGVHFVKTGEYAYRDPEHKTVYVIANYFIDKVELYINDKLVGSCTEPLDSFVYSFENIDVTESGVIKAVGYDVNGKVLAEHFISTVGEPAQLKLTPVTGPKGLVADGADVAFFDVEVLDEEGRLCPLCFERIDFSCEGPAKFLGGYNSGRFNGYGKEDSVIHANHVYAECGNNRVFVRASEESGVVTLKAVMDYHGKKLEAQASIESISVKGEDYFPQTMLFDYEKEVPESPYAFAENYEYNKAKYKPEGKTYYKVLINGNEVDMKGIRNVYEQSGVFGPIRPVLDRIISTRPGCAEYTYDEEKHILTMRSGSYEVVAEAGRTHLIVNGEENLMGSEPEIHKDGVMFMEIATMINYIEGVKVEFDERIGVLRVTP